MGEREILGEQEACPVCPVSELIINKTKISFKILVLRSSDVHQMSVTTIVASRANLWDMKPCEI